MIIANFINNSVLFVAKYVFIIKYEFRRVDKDRKKNSKEVVPWKKNCFVKCGEVFQFEE